MVMSDSVTDDPTVTALLAMTEYFLGQSSPSVCEAARCLLAVLAIRPVARVEASVRLRLGLLLSEHTSCYLEAREQLEKAMLVAGGSSNLQQVRFHAASSLASLLATQGRTQQARGLLRGKLEATTHHSYWHIRFLLQLGNLLASEGDVPGQLSVLSRCADYCQKMRVAHTHLLVTLARGTVLLTHHNYTDAGQVLNQASTLLDTHRGPGLPLLRTFYLTIQVAHLLSAGQVKTAKPHLKQLQQCVQSLSTQTDDKVDSTAVSGFSGVEVQPAEDFFWLTKHHAYITVYLVSVFHSVQAGLTEKALLYISRALDLIQQEDVSNRRQSGVLGILRAHVLEQSVQCLLMRGETASAGAQLQDLAAVCRTHHTLIYSHRAVLHVLLGLYAFAMSRLDRAIAQFQAALQHTDCKELHLLASLNLAICFMKLGAKKEAELAALMASINSSDKSNITCQSLQSALSYVCGLYSFTTGRLHEAKRQLRETLTIANGSDLNKLTSCSLLLLGQIFMALGNNKETLDMVTPALQLSVKMPENSLQIWAASLLADLYRTLGQTEREMVLRQQSNQIAQQLEQDKEKAGESSAHQLLQWTLGEWPGLVPAETRTQKAPASPPPCSTVTVNGNPLVLKTPEILLKKVESPSHTTPQKSLFHATANKPQTAALHSHATPRRQEVASEVTDSFPGKDRRLMGNTETERLSSHLSAGQSEYEPQQPSEPDRYRSRPYPEIAANALSLPVARSQNQLPQKSPRLSLSPRGQPSPGSSPLTVLSPRLHHQRHTPPQSAGYSPLYHQPLPTLPSYEHSIQARTPPHLPGSSPHSPKLHHLSPSHTPPPSRLPTHTLHPGHTHFDPGTEQYMLQQRLLWEQNYLQTQQRMAPGTGYVHPLVSHTPPYPLQGGGLAVTPPRMPQMMAHLPMTQILQSRPPPHLQSGSTGPGSVLPLSPSQMHLHHHHGHR